MLHPKIHDIRLETSKRYVLSHSWIDISQVGGIVFVESCKSCIYFVATLISSQYLPIQTGQKTYIQGSNGINWPWPTTNSWFLQNNVKSYPCTNNRTCELLVPNTAFTDRERQVTSRVTVLTCTAISGPKMLSYSHDGVAPNERCGRYGSFENEKQFYLWQTLHNRYWRWRSQVPGLHISGTHREGFFTRSVRTRPGHIICTDTTRGSFFSLEF